MHNSRLIPAVLALSLDVKFVLAEVSRGLHPSAASGPADGSLQAANLPAPPKIEGDPSAHLPPPIATSMPIVPEPPKPAPPPRRTVVTAPKGHARPAGAPGSARSAEAGTDFYSGTAARI